MRFYKMSFGVQEPYRVVVDGTFLSHALESKIHVKEQLPKLLDGRVTPMVTDCIMNELRSLGSRALGAAIIAKGYYRLKCQHGSPIAAAECVRRQLEGGNSRGLLVATQDAELAKAVRERPGVPLIKLNGQVPYLEEPSAASKAAKTAGEAARLKASEWEMPRLPELRDTQRMAKAAAMVPPKKRKGPKGPNPLSCMKAKKKLPQTQSLPQATAAAAPASAAEPARQAKRVRSRKMGTRRAGEPVRPAGAQAPAVAGAPAAAAAAAQPAPRAGKRRRGLLPATDEG